MTQSPYDTVRAALINAIKFMNWCTDCGSAYDEIDQCAKALAALSQMQPEPVQKTAVEEREEWFFRWIARGKGNHCGMTMEHCANIIWEHPNNPYRNNNPWDDKAALDGQKGGAK